jgi:hypothetical protein
VPPAPCGDPVKPVSKHLLDPKQYPVTIQLVSGTTGTVVWERTVTLAEAKDLAHVEIPSFANTEHYPVRAEIYYADGTTATGGMS